MDWQLSVAGPAIFPVFWGLVRTPPEKRDQAAIDAGKVKINEAMKILDAQLEKTQFVASDDFSYGDIPVGIIAHRYLALVPDRPPMKGLERWHAALLARPPYKQHVVDIPLV
jgi:glutathione S-transferase